MEKNLLISIAQADPTLSLLDRLFGFWLLVWRGDRGDAVPTDVPSAPPQAMPDLSKFGPSIR